jgi:hypothetical protein
LQQSGMASYSYPRGTTMEHRGIQYWIRQGIEAHVWKWSFVIDDIRTVEGESRSRKYAMTTVTRAIDHQLQSDKRA